MTHLTFSKPYRDGQTIFWSPTRTGDYATDCATGRAAALELVNLMRDTTTPPNLLGAVIRDMIAQDRYEGCEAGFCAALAERVR